ncbi:DUF1028 domain-containing protein [Elioraea sp.]|uniref:DUF1028 domain-containing protein n=1 Tax=Elioraea sp. TaxID=2185103 RepID=UPI0025B8487D|nr:DUF1028 domain-containing protein [Elioraea sp.]
MTWSILARDPLSGTLGVAVATRFFAVGALCPHVEGGVAALSTQALMNPMYAAEGLAALRQGAAAPEVVAALTSADAGRAFRQLHILDAEGRIGQHTGGECVAWAGHTQGRDCSVAGNMLAGEGVILATARAYEAAAAEGLPMAERLLRALDAGEAAGGDARGKQSAALKVASSDPYADLDLRVDDHADPLPELRRLHRRSLARFAVYRRFLAGSGHPGTFDRAVINAAIAADGTPDDDVPGS